MTAKALRTPTPAEKGFIICGEGISGSKACSRYRRLGFGVAESPPSRASFAPTKNPVATTSSIRVLGPLFAFVEVSVDQVYQGIHRFLRLIPFSAQVDLGALAGGEHHHRHDAFAVDRGLRRAADPDGGVLELSRDSDKLGRRSGMQTQLVDDFNFLSRHRGVNPLAEVAVANLDILQGLLQELTQAFGQVDGAVVTAGTADGDRDIGAVAGGKAG